MENTTPKPHIKKRIELINDLSAILGLPPDRVAYRMGDNHLAFQLRKGNIISNSFEFCDRFEQFLNANGYTLQIVKKDGK